jgi:hypothetical protein
MNQIRESKPPTVQAPWTQQGSQPAPFTPSAGPDSTRTSSNSDSIIDDLGDIPT